MRGSNWWMAGCVIGLLSAGTACGGDSESSSSAVGGGAASGSAGDASGGTGNVTSGGTGNATSGGQGGAAIGGGTGGTAGSGQTPQQPDPFEAPLDVPDDTPVDELEDADFVALCEAITDYTVTAFSVGICRYFGAQMALDQGGADAMIQAMCVLVQAGCQAEVGAQPTTCEPPTGECNATVAEVEACTNDLAAAGGELADSVPECSELTAATELAPMDDPASLLDINQVGSCQTVFASGPGCESLIGIDTALGAGGAGGTPAFGGAPGTAGSAGAVLAGAAGLPAAGAGGALGGGAGGAIGGGAGGAGGAIGGGAGGAS